MFKSNKGRFGYLKKQAVRQGIFTVLMLFICAAIFLIAWKISGSPKNIATIASVLGMLPVSKSLVSFIMYIRAEKYSCEKDVYDAVNEYQKEVSNGILLYDSYMTAYDKVFPVKAIYIKNGCLVGLMDQGKTSVNDAKDHILEYMGKNNISGINVKIFDDKVKFLNRVKELAEHEPNYSEAELNSMALINNLTL